MTESSASNTPKPTPTSIEILREEAKLLRYDESRAKLCQGDFNWFCERQDAALNELDALRAEIAALKAKLEEAERRAEKEIRNADDAYMALRSGLLAERDAAESRATELAARVQMFTDALTDVFDYRGGAACAFDDAYVVQRLHDAYDSTSAADLAAHDDRIRREALEEAARKITFWLTNRFTVSEYKLASPFDIKAWVEIIILPHSGEKGEGG